LRLHEELVAWCHSAPVTPHYHFVQNSRALFGVLNRLVEKARGGAFPALHFETHGVERAPGPMATSVGLVLASQEIVSWRVLYPYLTAINEATRLNLLVFVAACYGSTSRH